MRCSALLCCRFADFLESRFQRSKRSNMSTAVLEGGPSADIYELCFQTAKRSYFAFVEVQRVYLLIDRNGIFMLWIVQLRALPSFKTVDLLMLRNSVFTVRNVEIWVVLSSNDVDLLMLRNRVFRLRIVQKYAVSFRKGDNLLKLRNYVFRLWNVQIRAVSSC